jgi:hypothetical protein
MNTTLRISSAALLIVVLLGSCKKDQPPAPAAPTPSTAFESPGEYFKADAGDYWIYQSLSIDTNGVETIQGTDSVYVIPDTVINGNTFHRYRGSWFTNGPITWTWRDSSYCIVNEIGHKLFTTQLFDQPLDSSSYPAIYYAYYSVPSARASISVPSGSYTNSLDFLGESHMISPGYLWDPIRYTHNYYVKNIGLVCEHKFYSNSPGTLERRLLRYHVN